MSVSSTYSGWHYDPQNSRLDYYYRGTRVGHFNASGQTLASGMALDASAGSVTLPTNLRTGIIQLPSSSWREVASNDIQNTATGAGGFLAKNTTPILERVNAATDKALRINWATGNSDEITQQFAYPPDLDDTAAVTVKLRLAKAANTDTTTTIAVGYFEGIGDTNAGTSTSALSVSTEATYSITIAASDVGAAPTFASVSLTPGTHANDAIYLYSAHVEYTRKTS